MRSVELSGPAVRKLHTLVDSFASLPEASAHELRDLVTSMGIDADASLARLDDLTAAAESSTRSKPPTMLPMPVQAKYVFLDVVGFSRNRSVDAQTSILDTLKRLVRDGLNQLEIRRDEQLLLPTGDGLCIAVLKTNSPLFDAHLRLALHLLESLEAYNKSVADPQRRFQVRIGIASNVDNLVVDINGRKNLAGAGINTAQRVMSLADGGQVLVASSDFDVLHQREEYRHTFVPYVATVKHGVQIRVYQYTAAGCHGLNTDTPSHFRAGLEEGRVLRAARVTGLTDIFPGREQAAREIKDRIPLATRRVWLLGVTLTVDLNIRDLIPVLKTHVDLGRDIRILLLDALRSPAVFRALLESTSGQAKRVVQYRRAATGRPGGDPYFTTRLYQDFRVVLSALSDEEWLLPSVRFYAHSPACWLVVIDDTAYVMPYTFGHLKHAPEKVSPLTSYTPVLKFETHVGGRTMSQVLASHFDRLWKTSDVDLFHEAVRMAEEDRILRKMFDDRGWWFKNVYDVVHMRKPRTHGCEADARIYPRMPCRWQSVRVVVEDGDERTTTKLLNYSRVGLCLERIDGSGLRRGRVVLLRMIGNIPTGAFAKRVIADELDGKRYRVIWVDSQQQKAGLQLVAPGEGYGLRRKIVERLRRVRKK